MIQKIKKINTREWRKKGTGTFIHESIKVIRDLRSEGYDLVLDLQGNSKSGLFTMFSVAPLRYGFDRTAVREWPNILATSRKVSLTRNQYHISDRSLAVAAAAFPNGTDRPFAGPLPVNSKARDAVEDKLKEERMSGDPLIVLHHGTTWNTKQWPVANWKALAVELVDSDKIRPVLTWGNEEELKVVQRIHEAASGNAVIWPKGDLKDLAALLKRADVVVGTDTGPIHIAAAVGTSTVSIYRVTDPERNGPRGKNHILLQSPLDCSPCLKKECDRDEECGQSIDVQMVLEAVGKLLNKPDKKHT